ncbi:MAG TPA: hypothetical protein VHV55_14940 [Pirellulales bacterium]|jgi:Na+/proline symporter|nr:hypothetical protein [Pirellulales bacterium]
MASQVEQPGTVFHWTLGCFICEAIPIASAFVISFFAGEPDPIEHLIGYALVMVVAIGLLGAVVVDMIVEDHRLGPNEKILCGLIAGALVVGMFAGMVQETMLHNAERFKGAFWFDPNKWFWWQVFLSLPAIFFAIKTKSDMLAVQRARSSAPHRRPS